MLCAESCRASDSSQNDHHLHGPPDHQEQAGALPAGVLTQLEGGRWPSRGAQASRW